jgi:hypothetical protein
VFEARATSSFWRAICASSIHRAQHLARMLTLLSFRRSLGKGHGRGQLFPITLTGRAKLATDIAAAVISLYFLWQHQLVVGLAIHFIPPPIASADGPLLRRPRTL